MKSHFLRDCDKTDTGRSYENVASFDNQVKPRFLMRKTCVLGGFTCVFRFVLYLRRVTSRRELSHLLEDVLNHALCNVHYRTHLFSVFF